MVVRFCVSQIGRWSWCDVMWGWVAGKMVAWCDARKGRSGRLAGQGTVMYPLCYHAV
jgi:hypothetical protein